MQRCTLEIVQRIHICTGASQGFDDRRLIVVFGGLVQWSPLILVLHIHVGTGAKENLDNSN